MCGSEPPRCEGECERVLDTLASERFVDRSPAELVATLPDEGQYPCSERTMYRILAANQPVRERRNQLTHPQYARPELVATGPNRTWSRDIERHEALLNLVVVRDRRHRPVAAGRLKLRAA